MHLVLDYGAEAVSGMQRIDGVRGLFHAREIVRHLGDKKGMGER